MEDNENDEYQEQMKTTSKKTTPLKNKKAKKGKKAKKAKITLQNARDTHNVESDNENQDDSDAQPIDEKQDDTATKEKSEPNTIVQPTDILEQENEVIEGIQVEQTVTTIIDAPIVEADNDLNVNNEQNIQQIQQQVEKQETETEQPVFITQGSNEHFESVQQLPHCNEQIANDVQVDEIHQTGLDNKSEISKSDSQQSTQQIAIQTETISEDQKAIQQEILNIQKKENDRRQIEEEQEIQRQLKIRIEIERKELEEELRRQQQQEKILLLQKQEEDLKNAEKLRQLQQEKISKEVNERLAEEQRQKQEQINKNLELQKKINEENQKKIEQYQKLQEEEKNKKIRDAQLKIQQQKIKDEEKLKKQQKIKEDYEKMKEKEKLFFQQQQQKHQQEQQQQVESSIQKKVQQLEETIVANQLEKETNDINWQLSKQLLETNYQPELHRPAPKQQTNKTNYMLNNDYHEQIDHIKLDGVDIDKLLKLKKETEHVSKFEQTLNQIQQKQKQYKIDTIKNWENIDKSPVAQINKQITIQQPLPPPEKKVNYTSLLMEEKRKLEFMKQAKQKYDDQMNPKFFDTNQKPQSPIRQIKVLKNELKQIQQQNTLFTENQVISHQTRRSTQKSILSSNSQKELIPTSHRNTIGSKKLQQIQEQYLQSVDNAYKQIKDMPSIYTIVRLDDFDDQACINLDKYRQIPLDGNIK